jgi:hypothetical protein
MLVERSSLRKYLGEFDFSRSVPIEHCTRGSNFVNGWHVMQVYAASTWAGAHASVQDLSVIWVLSRLSIKQWIHPRIIV